MKKAHEYLTYYTPSFVYIPYDKSELLSVKNKVYNNMLLGKKSDNTNIFSNVSGILLGSKNMNTLNGIVSTLVIENDFIDKRRKNNSYKNIKSIDKNYINEQLIKHNLYKKMTSNSILVVESTYNKKNDLGDMVINYEYYENILETLDELLSIYNIKCCYLVINSDDIISISAYNKYINAFPNITIVHGKGKINNKKSVLYTVEDILSINKAIHFDYTNDTTMITINDRNNIIILKVKLYTLLSELLETLKIKKYNKIYINNNISDINNFIITKDIKTIRITE